MTVTENEAELRQYWRASREARARQRANIDTTEQRDDLNLIALHTDWPRLRGASQSAEVQLTPRGVAACESSA